MDNLGDVNLRAEAIGPLSAHLNNHRSRAGLRWDTLDQFDANINYMNGIHSAINDGWRDIITTSGNNNKFNLKFMPLERLSSVSFTGDYIMRDPEDGAIPTIPVNGIYDVDGSAYLKTDDNENIPEEQRYTATYRTYNNSIPDRFIHIPRAATQFVPSKGHARLHMVGNPWKDLHSEASPDTWDNCEKMDDRSFVYHSYPSLEYLLADYVVKDHGMRKVYEYRGVDEILISEKNGRNISIVFDADVNNLDINVIMKFSDDIQDGEYFNLAVHYDSTKVINNTNIDQHNWPKLIVCGHSTRLFATGDNINGMYQYITSYGDIQGSYAVTHGTDQYAYMAMIGGVPCINLEWVYGCIGRQPIIETTHSQVLATRWCEYNNPANFASVASYYIKLMKAGKKMIPISIISSYNGGIGLTGMANNA